MDPNILTNVGTNLGTWIVAGAFWVFAIIMLVWISKIFTKWRAAVRAWDNAGRNPDDERDAIVHFRKLAVFTLTTGGLIATAIWITVAGFGPGTPVSLPDPKADGFYEQTQEAPEEPTEEERDKAAEAKKPAVLREVEEISAKDAGTEDDYIRKAIERSKGMLGD